MSFPSAVDFERALAAAGIGLWCWDPESDRISLSGHLSARLAAVCEEAGGQALLPLPLIEGTDLAALRAALQAAQSQRGDRPCDCLLRIRVADGSACRIRLRGGGIRGDTVLVAGFLDEVTEQEPGGPGRAESRSEDTRKLELAGRFSGEVVHDFGNLLSVITGNLDLLREMERSPEARRYVEEALSAAREGEALTRRLLAFLHQAETAPVLVNPGRVIGDMEGMLRHILPEAIAVELCSGRDLWPVEIDIASFESALLDLVMTMRDATDGAGRLTITAANHCHAGAAGGAIPEGRYVAVSISADGARPVPAASAAPVARAFAGTAGGYLDCPAGPEGEWMIRLLLPAPGLAGAGEIPPVRAEEAGLSGRVLLVEDEPLVLHMMERRLSKLGLDCVSAPTGAEALRRFDRDGPFDLLVTDIVMPGAIQGPGLVTHLRRQQPDLPVIFVSGYANDDATMGGALPPRAIRLMKPVSKSDLLIALRRQLPGRGASCVL
ncbi:MAG: response regulator [Tropicimonas sp.]|uniref:response regulator n=1 Tax=Tropicimonas sp. TaxID=2067044 RepID=UPI003A83EA7B